MSQSQVYIDNLSYALGEQQFPVEASVAAGRTLTSQEAFKEAGFQQHWIAAPTTTAYDLAVAAVDPIKEQLNGLGTIIYSTCLTLNGNLGTWSDFTQSRDVKHLLDYPASHLQAYLKVPGANVIGLNQQACTSVLGSIRIARALLLAEPSLEKILCVSADRFPETAVYEQAYNLISDGASAFTVSREPKGYKVLGSAAITNGALAQASDDETVGTYFNFTHQAITKAAADANMNIRDIDWVIPQNTNMKAWQILSRVLGIPFEKICCRTLGSVGHIISSDNIVNLTDLAKSGQLKPGQRLLLCMAGYGLNWQATIIEKC
jgi:3-oxoacyl-[acyl-carrier-protein] synthase III